MYPIRKEKRQDLSKSGVCRAQGEGRKEKVEKKESGEKA